MPWQSIDDLPEQLRSALSDYTEQEKRLWLSVANKCLERPDADEGACIAAAHRAVQLHRQGNDARVMRNEELPDQAPEWVELAHVGVWLGHPRGPEVITPQSLRSAMRAFERHQEEAGNSLVIDYHHQSLRALRDAGPSAPAAGWIQDMELRENGASLYGRVDWTDKAEQHIEQREYRYLSPVFRFDKADPVTGEPVPLQIHSVGLTNTPFITSMQALNENVLANEHPDGPGESGQSVEGGQNMDLLELLANSLGIEPEKAAEILGIEPGVENEAVAEAVKSHVDRAAELETQLDDQPVVNSSVAQFLGVDPDSDERTVIGALADLETDDAADVIRNELDLDADAGTGQMLEAIRELKEDRQEGELDELIANARQAGKLPPGDSAREKRIRRLFGHDEELARDYVANMDVIVQPGQERTPEEQPEADGLSESDRTVAGQLEIEPERMAS